MDFGNEDEYDEFLASIRGFVPDWLDDDEEFRMDPNEPSEDEEEASEDDGAMEDEIKQLELEANESTFPPQVIHIVPSALQHMLIVQHIQLFQLVVQTLLLARYRKQCTVESHLYAMLTQIELTSIYGANAPLVPMPAIMDGSAFPSRTRRYARSKHHPPPTQESGEGYNLPPAYGDPYWRYCAGLKRLPILRDILLTLPNVRSSFLCGLSLFSDLFESRLRIQQNKRTVRAKFSAAEEALFAKGLMRYGHKGMHLIQEHYVPGRTVMELKNRWHNRRRKGKDGSPIYAFHEMISGGLTTREIQIMSEIVDKVPKADQQQVIKQSIPYRELQDVYHLWNALMSGAGKPGRSIYPQNRYESLPVGEESEEEPIQFEVDVLEYESSADEPGAEMETNLDEEPQFEVGVLEDMESSASDD